ncbi:MAG: IS4 family transposase, partial [Myxococcaceae bacterium]|nr:IS4 family transposase [Myxococcaceae bacterium]
MATGAKKGPGAAGQKADTLAAFRELVAPEDIIEAACRLGAIQRQRKVDMPALVEATIAAVLPTPGVQTTAFANYIALTGQQLAPSAFYDRFSLGFAELMREVALRAVAGVARAAPEERRLEDFGVLLEKFSDIQVADSTCHLLRKLAQHWAPSTSKVRPAGIKWHAVVSLKDGLPVAEALTPQRTHDNVALPEGALAPGTLTLFDLGYLDVLRFIDAIESGAHFLTRLKTSHNPVILRVHVGKGERVKARGMRLEDALEQGVLQDDAGAVDVDVQLEKAGRTATARVTAVLAPDGQFHWYLTTVGRDVLTVDEVAQTYRLRWYVELFFKQLKSGAGLKAILASRPGAVMALLYAKVTALALARLLELSIEERHGPHA